MDASECGSFGDVKVMRTRHFFLFALLTAIISVVFHVTALGQFARGAERRARAVTLVEAERAAASVEADVYSTRAHVAMYAGMALAASSIALVTLSARKREPARRSIVYGLLLCYGLLQLVLI